MAITRITQSGFEARQFTSPPEGFDAGTILEGSGAGNIYTGTYGGVERYNGNNVQKQTGAIRQIRSGFWAKISDGQGRIRFAVRDSSFNRLVHLEWKVDQSVGLNVNDTEQDTASSVHIGGFIHYGIDVKIHATTGWANFYVNGILKASFSGNTGNVDIYDVVWGALTGSSDVWSYYDDIYLDDTTGEGSATPPPALRFHWVGPNGNGNYAQWDGSDGNSTDNYQLLDERPPSSSDYIDTAVTDEFDSFAMDTVTIPSNETIEAYIPIVRAKRGDTTELIALGTRYSSTDLIGSDQTPTTVEDFFVERQATKPGGGAWDQTALDGVEVVVKSRGTY
jgi:hypothetical protein